MVTKAKPGSKDVDDANAGSDLSLEAVKKILEDIDDVRSDSGVRLMYAGGFG